MKRQTKEAKLDQIKDWDFKGDGKYKNVIVREELMDQILKRLRAYEKPKDNTDPGPLIDEQIWTFLFVYGYRNHQKDLFAALTGAAAVEPCEAWLEMLPMPARKGAWKGGSEGNSNIDLVTGSLEIRDGTKSGVQYRPSGPICLVEAKWKSDIAGYTSHDPQRNQLARVIETAATLQHHVGTQVDLAERFPDEVYVTLLTPRIFRVDRTPASRFYAYKYLEYSWNPSALVHDVDHSKIERRPSGDWIYPTDIEQRLRDVTLRWVTFEDLYASMPDKDFKKALGRFIHEQPEASLLDPNDFPLEGE